MTAEASKSEAQVAVPSLNGGWEMGCSGAAQSHCTGQEANPPSNGRVRSAADWGVQPSPRLAAQGSRYGKRVVITGHSQRVPSPHQLVEASFTPAQTIQIMTLNGARILGVADWLDPWSSGRSRTQSFFKAI